MRHLTIFAHKASLVAISFALLIPLIANDQPDSFWIVICPNNDESFLSLTIDRNIINRKNGIHKKTNDIMDAYDMVDFVNLFGVMALRC